MFIRAANSRAGTGYTTDVNTAFRQGRQDAYRDYIDNYNFALKADVANNVENQRQVERVAKNYGLDLSMDQAARQDAYNFIAESDKINKAKTDMGIHFARDARLSDPTVTQELGTALASKYVADTQAGAVKSNTDLSNAEFTQGQLPVDQETKGIDNQMKLISAKTGLTTATLRNLGAEAQTELVNINSGLQDEELLSKYVARMREIDPDNQMTDEQLKAEAMNNINALRDAEVRERGNQHVAAVRIAGGNIDGANVVYDFNPASKGSTVKTQTQKEKTTTADKTEAEPTVSSLGKVSAMSQDDFDKHGGNMVLVNGHSGVYKYGNSIVVQNSRGGYNVYDPHVYTVGKNKQYESEADLLARALKASGRSGEQGTKIADPKSMR